jgi:4-diphosphocytidyl-2-C-methyl-D-erythritol kinase
LSQQEIEVFAPAKINLALHVTGRRNDGYHLMDMLVAFATTGDRLRVRPAVHDRFRITGPYASAIPHDGGNLVLRARDAMRKAAGASACPPAEIELDKVLPPASGMGGGSSDAAATLKALARIWAVVNIDLAAVAATLGADVPMCLAATPLRARGIGEIIEPVSTFPPTPAVLVNPGVEVSTPAVFRALAQKENLPLPKISSLAIPADVAAYMARTRNDLQPPALALAPVISDALAAIARTDPLAFRMTGSGATCFGLYASTPAAAEAANAIRLGNPGWYVVATELS